MRPWRHADTTRRLQAAVASDLVSSGRLWHPKPNHGPHRAHTSASSAPSSGASGATIFSIPPTAAGDDWPSSSSSSGRGSGRPIELMIRQQFTAPPGGIDPGVDSTGRFVWPTARMLLERVQRDFLADDKGESDVQVGGRRHRLLRVLELGAGCGYLGMALAATGRAEVVLTDQPSAVDWLRGNVELNRAVLGDRATVAAFRWGEADPSTMDTTLLRRPFDLIVGSDLLYDNSAHGALVTTMDRFAGRGAGSRFVPVYLAYPRRGDDGDHFLKIARERFDITTESLDVVGTAQVDSTDDQVTPKFSLAICSRKK